jgi:putative N6-adenine-specific DNA methylase
VIVDELRIIGSTQTNVVMIAELTRVAQRAIRRRPPNPRKEGLGQLVMPFDRDLAWAAVTYMRTPTRVLWDLYRLKAARLEPLYDELVADLREDTRALWRDGDGISVEARRVEDFAAGERQVVGTVKNAIIDVARQRGARLHVDPERPASRWVARIDDRGEIVISIDLGGGSLSQRGWRSEAGEAPLREHLAAVLLMLARFDPRTDILVDPMCGSGTIAIEAVLAARLPPRPTPTLTALGITSPDGKPPQPLFADAQPIAIGCDIDLEVLAAARDNSRAAGVASEVTWQRADITTLRPELIADIARERGRADAKGVLLSNPPYGERLDEADLRALYAAIAHTCKKFPGWRAAFLVGNPLFEETLLGILGSPRIKKPLANANLRAYFYLYDL